MTTTTRVSTITLDDLIALNDEIAALVRAGVPLDRGLDELAMELPSGLGKLTAALSTRIARGESLPQALTDPQLKVPPLYRAIISVGLHTGRLPVALESLAHGLRRMSELRRALLLAMVYPLLVLSIIYALFVFFVVAIVPRLDSFAEDLQATAVWSALMHARQWVYIWGWLAPVVALTAVLLWFAWSRRASVAYFGPSGRGLRWFPGWGTLVRDARTAGYCDLLGLLVEQNVPLPQAVQLAAQASGDSQLIENSQRVSEQLAAGAPAPAAWQNSGAPPLLRWLIASGQQHGTLAESLRHSADHYRWRATIRAERLRAMTPLVLIAGVGGTATLLYGVSLFWPWYATLFDLSFQ